jgi:hypothetical protein
MNDFLDDKEDKSQDTFALKMLSLSLFVFMSWVTFNMMLAFIYWITQFFPGATPNESLEYSRILGFWKTIELIYTLIIDIILFVLSLKLLKGRFRTLKWLRIALAIDVLVFLGIVVIYIFTGYKPKVEEGFEVSVIYTIIEAVFLILLNHPKILEQVNQAQKA